MDSIDADSFYYVCPSKNILIKLSVLLDIKLEK